MLVESDLKAGPSKIASTYLQRSLGREFFGNKSRVSSQLRVSFALLLGGAWVTIKKHGCGTLFDRAPRTCAKMLSSDLTSLIHASAIY
jgi:hypothetical protein